MAKTKPEELRDEINEVFNELLKVGAIHHYKYTKLDHLSDNIKKYRVSWDRDISTPLVSFSELNVKKYEEWLKQKDFTSLLNDGSIIQATFTLSSDFEITHYRLVYVPTPILYDLFPPDFSDEDDGVATSQINELIVNTGYDDLLAKSKYNDLVLRSPLRFDFDPINQKEGHNASHLTLNTLNCRLKIEKNLSIYDFLEFIYSNFYPEIFEDNSNLFKSYASRSKDWKYTYHPYEDLHSPYSICFNNP